jgi:ComF family protein
MLNFIGINACPRCGRPYSDDGRGRDDCPNCRSRSFSFRSGRALFECNGLGRAIIHELKYRNGHFLLPDIGRLSRNFFGELRGKILVPVPLHWWRRWQRGYNQSELICQVLAREHDCRVIHLLRRHKFNRRQTDLCRQDRYTNVAKSFSLCRRVLEKSNINRSEEIYIVDDVLTTGSTIDACAKVLEAAGFLSIHARAVARAF